MRISHWQISLITALIFALTQSSMSVGSALPRGKCIKIALSRYALGFITYFLGLRMIRSGEIAGIDLFT